MAKTKIKPEEAKQKRKRGHGTIETVADPAAAEAGATSKVEFQGLVKKAAEAFPEHPVANDNSTACNIVELSFNLGAKGSEGDGETAWYQPEISDTIKNVVGSVKALIKSIGPRLTIRFRVENNAIRLRVIDSRSQRNFDFHGGTFPGDEAQAAPQAIAKTISDTFASISNETAEGLNKKIEEGAIKPAAIDFARTISRDGIGITVKDGDSETDIPVPAQEKIPMRTKSAVRGVCMLSGTITAKGSDGEYYLDSGEVQFKSDKDYEIGSVIKIVDATLTKSREMKIAESYSKIEVLPQIK